MKTDTVQTIENPVSTRSEGQYTFSTGWLNSLLKHAALLLLAFVMLYPVLWMIASSFRPENEIFGTISVIPTNITFDNYKSGWNFFGDMKFSTFFINSFTIATLAVVGNLVTTSMAGYAFARLSFKWKSLWFGLMLGSIMLPFHVQLIPQYIMFLKFGWVDTFVPLVLPKFLAVDSFFVFLMVQFMRTLPMELEEAAQMDGASYFRRYSQIILPLSVPVLATTAVFTFIFAYNDYLTALLYLTNIDKMTVQQGLRLFLDSGGGTSAFGGLFAMSVLSLVPVFLLYLVSQRLLVRGIATTGFK